MLYEVTVLDIALDEMTDTAIIEAPNSKRGAELVRQWAIEVGVSRCILLDTHGNRPMAVVEVEVSAFWPKRIGYMPENNRPHPISSTIFSMQVTRKGPI